MVKIDVDKDYYTRANSCSWVTTNKTFSYISPAKTENALMTKLKSY